MILCKIFSNSLNIGRSMFSEVRRAWAFHVMCFMLCSRRRADAVEFLPALEWALCLQNTPTALGTAGFALPHDMGEMEPCICGVL